LHQQLQVQVLLVVGPFSFHTVLQNRVFQDMLVLNSFLVCLITRVSAVFDVVGNASHGRLLSHAPTHVVCPSGYIDHTQGTASFWECAKECPGEWAWGDIHCECACVLPRDCVASTNDDPCVTRGELQNLREKVLEVRVNAYTPAPIVFQEQVSEAPVATPTPAPLGPHGGHFLQAQAATTSAPPHDDSLGPWIIFGVCIVSLAVCAFVIAGFTCWMSLVLGADAAPPTPKVHPAPEASVAPLPHLFVRTVPLKSAWADVKGEDGWSNVSTRSPCSPAPSPPASARSAPSPSDLDQKIIGREQLSVQSPRPEKTNYGAQLSPIPRGSLYPSPRNNNSTACSPSPRANAHSNASPTRRHSAPSPRCSNLRPGPCPLNLDLR